MNPGRFSGRLKTRTPTHSLTTTCPQPSKQRARRYSARPLLDLQVMKLRISQQTAWSAPLRLLRRTLQDANGTVFVQLYKIGVKGLLHGLRDQSFTPTG